MLLTQPVESEIEVREHGRQEKRGLLDLLRYLTTLDGSASQIVSLSLDCRWSDEHQRERVSLALRHRMEAEITRCPDDQALAESMDHLREFIDLQVRQMGEVGHAGVALFSCQSIDLNLALLSAAPLPTLLTVGPVPTLRPLAATLHGHERALLAVIDTNGARLFNLSLGTLEPWRVVTGEVPNRQKRGGWSQLHFQHHRAEHVAAVHREVVQVALQMLYEVPGMRLLVGGLQEAVANLKSLLPPRVAERLICLEGLSTHTPEHELLTEARNSLRTAAEQENREALEEIKGLAMAGGRAVLGLERVVQSFNEKRVLRALVGGELATRIAYCPRCVTNWIDSILTCALCARPLVALEASEAMTHTALATRARIDIVPLTLVAKQGGAAAVLRF
jgi:peptide chain release factor subunit 1